MTALIIIAIVLLGISTVLDLVVIAIDDGSEMTAIAFLNAVPNLVAIVALALCL